MELQRSSPPAYIAHNPADLNLPSVPQTAISQPHVQAEITLPDLRTVLSPDFHQTSLLSDSLAAHRGSPSSVRSLPRIDPGHAFSNGTRTSLESNVASPSETGSAMSIDERGGRSTSVLSMDDPDVRIAAEALSGLGNPGKSYLDKRQNECCANLISDFVRSPQSVTRSHASPDSARAAPTEPEPLLELFTKAHPWVVGTINGSLNAYSTTKNYSPRLVQYGANLLERNIGNPMATTVSSVGRMTGVESGLRWYYGSASRTSHDLDRSDVASASKRIRLGDDEMDLESGQLSPTNRLRRESQDSRSEILPAYNSGRPPSYREEASPGNEKQLERSADNRSWSSQVFVMTSGLGAALSITSRRSLRYCLSLLGQSAERISTLMDALKMVLEEYDKARDSWHRTNDSAVEKGERPRTPDHDEAARHLATLLKKHSDEIWHTLQNVVYSVSNYAGAALPDNAKQFVRNQLMSLPQRWRFVSENQVGDGETSRSAHRMIAFATEGLDMMSQVSQTMKLTLESAEQWLERVGRRRDLADSSHTYEKDYEMGDAEPRRPHPEKQ